MSALRLVLLTNGSIHAHRLLKGFHERGVPVEAVVFETRPRWSDNQIRTKAAPEPSILRTLRRWIGWRIRANIVRRWAATYGSRVVLTGPLNSERMCADLRSLLPDVLVLGGIGILSEEVLRSVPCTINGHPGLLPWVRGTSVVECSVRRGIPVGATCHYVTTGIDRGGIIERRLLEPTAPPASLADLEDRADILAADLLVDVVGRIAACGKLPPALEQSDVHPICRAGSRVERLESDADLRSGRASVRFEAWLAKLDASTASELRASRL
jgi:hypothetical protein